MKYEYRSQPPAPPELGSLNVGDYFRFSDESSVYLIVRPPPFSCDEYVWALSLDSDDIHRHAKYTRVMRVVMTTKPVFSPENR